jgi:hypothetical protein
VVEEEVVVVMVVLRRGGDGILVVVVVVVSACLAGQLRLPVEGSFCGASRFRFGTMRRLSIADKKGTQPALVDS